MRRIFIIRKDLHLSPGKLAAMVGHAAELYWLNLLKNGGSYTNYDRDNNPTAQSFEFYVPHEVWTDYINGIYTKTICESRNLNHLLKAKAIADELGFRDNEDYGFINDKCLTELNPENDDGTTTVGMWFAPLADEVAHKISRKFPLLRDHEKKQTNDIWRIGWEIAPKNIKELYKLLDKATAFCHEKWLAAMKSGDAPPEDVSPGEGFALVKILIQEAIAEGKSK